MTEKQILRKLARIDDRIEACRVEAKRLQEEKRGLRSDLSDVKRAKVQVRGKRLAGSPGGMSANMHKAAPCTPCNV